MILCYIRINALTLIQAFYVLFGLTILYFNYMMLCDKCKKKEVQIFNDCCDCCISCWYDMTDPKVS
jgi:hypothetical protein